MSATKLVKKLFVLILLLNSEALLVKGIRANNEEEPDTPYAQHIVYDQRQSGKYNIHVVIKDVAIIEMDQNKISDQNYGDDDDYYYDEGDLTVKPISIKTSTSSVKPLEISTTIKTNIPTLQSTIFTTENQRVKPTTSPILPTTTIYTISQNNNADLSTYQPAVDTKSRSKIEPIYAVEESIIKPRQRLQDFNYGLTDQAQARDKSQVARKDSKIFKNSRIYKVKLQRSQQHHQLAPRCHSFQYRDVRGNCRGKRSSSESILKRLLRMLVTLPFNPDEQQNDD